MPYSNIWFDGTECSSFSFSAVSAPAAGTRYSNRFPGDGSFPPGRVWGKGRYSGINPNWTNIVAWSQAICSWYSRSPRIFTIAVIGMRRDFPVGGIPGILLLSTWVVAFGLWCDDLQPVNFLIMSQTEDKLVYYPICPNSTTDEI